MMSKSENLDISSNLKSLITKRSSIKGQITKFKNYISKITEQSKLTSIEFAELSLKLGRFESLSAKFDELQSQIELLNSDSLEEELDEREHIEQELILCTAMAKSLIESQNEVKMVEQEQKRRQSLLQDAQCSFDLSDSIKLPQLQIAKFDGSYFRWLEFRDTFRNIIHNNHRIPMIQKFHYLLSYLEGDAVRIVSNIEVSSANYLNAWQLLLDRYDNKKLLINHHLKSLFNVQQFTRESESSLRYLVDHVTKNLRALSNLGQPTDRWDTLIIFMLSSKLDSHTLIKWEEYRSCYDDYPTLDQFNKFLITRADILESLNRNKECTSKFHHAPSKHLSNIKSFASVEKSPTACIICRENHKIYECPSFLSKSIEDRLSVVAKHKLCSNCLRRDHHVSKCHMGPCRHCKKRHNTLLHTNSITSANLVETQESTSIVNFTREVSSENSQILLSTALVQIVNPVTKEIIQARALLDSGSQSSFITKNLQRKLSLNTTPISLNIIGIGNNCLANTANESCVVQLQPRTSINDFKITFSCLILNCLTGKLPRFPIEPNQLNIPKDLLLADPGFGQSTPIDVLLGADIFWDVIGSEQKSLGQDKPKLHSSKLGWLIGGKFSDISSNILTNECSFSKKLNKSVKTYSNYVSLSKDPDSFKESQLDYQLAKFWQLEEVPQRSILSESEAACEKHFLMSTVREKNGRFCVRLPLRESPNCLGDSYSLARKRFLNMERRFRKNPKLKLQYTQFIKEYQDLGHLSESCTAIPNPSYFLCHHAVIKDSSESTKLRVVFDGSAPSSSGYSINDLQLVGPNVQDSLFAILLRARLYKYVLSGDIEKMYRQINVACDQRNLQLILWRDSENLPIKTMRLNTVTYGTASASYLSTRCLVQLGEECEDKLIKTIIQKDFYVDDLITGSNDESELLFIKNNVTSELKKGCFNLRKFKSNLSSVVDASQDLQDNLTVSESYSTLGLGWNPNSDTIFFPIVKPLPTDKVTKRFIMSNAFKIFDPLGLLSPCIMQAKLILQSLWQQKIDWDEPVPDNIINLWNNFSNNLTFLSNMQIPRYVLSDSAESIELHCFSDASQVGYGACIYMRTIDSHGNAKTSLLCSKSKVAPLKPTSIPRLELCAALLSTRLCKIITDSIRLSINRILYWCDSSVVLGWLRGNPSKFKTFVANRVGEILEISNSSSWRYVPTAENPADLISRGVNPSQLEGSELWWYGPSFLSNEEAKWPRLKEVQTITLPETKVTKTLIALIYEPIIDFNRFSKFVRLQRTMCYVRRFINNIKNSNLRRSGTLTVEELKDSFNYLCFIAQQQSFYSEFKTLANNKTLSTKSKILSLSPFIDDKTNLIRVGGRIVTSQCSYDKIHPILLDSKHHLCKLIFEHEHVRNLHAGPQLLLSAVRETVWPINGRRLARTIVRNCVRCRRVQGKTLNPKMGNLPSQRVTPDFPFSSVGMDYAGPFYILNRKGRGSRLIKCYLCLFVCLRYKCLHLEAVSDLSKDAFIMTLRRFISRRGRPAELFSDNGRNFVAAAKELSVFLKQHSAYFNDFAAQEGFKFIFTPSYAPHFGGIWEAGVKSAKFHIRRVMGNSHLTFEEISTLFAQVESILNSRPLCPLSSSPNDFLFLSPGHFLIGRPLNDFPSPALEYKSESNLSRYYRLEKMRLHFWKRWQKEYISELQLRTKWKTNKGSLKVGDLVLLQEDSLPPLCWTTGRVAKLFPGPDSISRVADVSTAKGYYRRPLVRLCPLLPDEDVKN